MRPDPENLYYQSELRLAAILREEGARSDTVDPRSVNQVLRADA